MVKPGYKQTEIGVIPEEWEIRFLPFFGDVVSGGTPSTNISAYWNGAIAWCTPSDITSTAGTNISDTEKHITEQGLAKSAATLLPPGALLLCTRATIGDAKINSVPMATNQGFKNVVPNNCNILFLYYLLQTKKKEMLEKAIGSTFLEISKSALCSIPLQYPQLSEQNRIAAALSDVDELIASLGMLIAKKKAIKQGAMQELLTGRRRLPGFSGEWAKFNLMRHSRVKARIGWQGLKKSEYLENGYAYLVTGTDFDDGIVHWSSCHYVDKKRYDADRNIQLKNGDLLVTKDGSLGKTAIVKELDIPATLNSGIFVIRPLNEAYYPAFVYYVLSSFIFRDFLDKLSAGSTIIHLYQKDVDQFEFFIPPTIQEQRAIAMALSEMEDEIQSMEQKLKKARHIKQGMMRQLLTGKIRLA